MPYKGHKTITVKESLFKELERVWKEKGQNKYRSFSSWVSELLGYVLERDGIIRLCAPYLQSVGADDNILYIKDHKLKKIAEISIKHSNLYCNICRSEYCIHTAFSIAIPEVARIINNHMNLAIKHAETDGLSK